ncbi:hypothetical protein A6A04_05265 [Paramagnetospirillum marisnigri]|uniref:DUF115 domain-containing protein n=1 Tax=Paramagnetospirillum marisnigri TaxID=1285242 RepID=A0A178MHH0_9PROT|nr:6-hydroxymethylpterin diphosphokinase MptE-like protein [Paramagnetospirillum marisnigri]OAN48161.1 hypothetical protein A6A04_05265 [Paramagnetospirillum marisnigri]
MTEAADGSPGLFERNLELFRRRFPEVHERLTAIRTPLSSIIRDQGVPVDIDLGSGRLYKCDGRELALAQARDFIETPRRVGYQVVNAMSGDSPSSARLFNSMLDSVVRHKATVLTGAPVCRAGFLFVFGLGLGHHLPTLVESLTVDWVVVVEAIDEFVLHSLATIDWSAIADRCDQTGTKLSFVLGELPVQLVRDLAVLVEEQGDLGIDGSYYYRHYPSWALDKAFEDLVNNVPLKMIQRGYFEDERKMLWNTIANLQKYDCHMLSGDFQLPISAPAFLITSGPSVDNDIEYIKKWRDHAVIFSGGSSLQILLAHGIVPDYHVELENVVQVWDFFEHMLDLNAERFPERRFTGIKLVASATVNPRISALFDESYYFFRDSVVSTRCFKGDFPEMTAIGPNVANTIVAVAARMGFRHVYLFGMDCGWRDGESHHSKNTAYYTSKTFKTGKMVGDYSFPGNFGGTIQSNLVLSWTRDMLEGKVTKFGLRAFNCSDGGFIKGTVPKLSEALEFEGQPLDREAIYARVRKDATFLAKGSYLPRFDFPAYIAEIDAFEAAIDGLYAAIQREGHDFRWMLHRLTEINRNWVTSPYSHVYAMFVGPTIGMAKCGCVFLNRIEDPDELAAVFADFLATYHALLKEMVDETRAIFQEGKAWIDGGPEPQWAKGLQTTPGYTF